MTAPLRTTSCALPRSRAMRYSSLRERFTLWATMSWFSRFSRIAIRLFGFTIGAISTRRPKSRGRCKVDQAFACIEFGASDSGLVAPLVETTTPVKRERLFDCHAFLLWRVLGQEPFTVGATAEPRVLVGIEGSGQIMHDGIPYAVGKGDVWLLPAEAGECAFQPSGEVTLLEIAIP